MKASINMPGHLLLNLVYLSVALSVTPDTTLTLVSTDADTCRDRLGNFLPETFKISSCALCYFYLVTDQPHFHLNRAIHFKNYHKEPYYLLKTNASESNEGSVYPSIDNPMTLDLVCTTIKGGGICDAWIKCCQNAWTCCQKQRSSSVSDMNRTFCPQTFDGWDCWNYTEPNKTVEQPCPEFLTSKEGALSSKRCGFNGRWAADASTGLEYTNYNRCTKTPGTQIYKTSIVVGLVLNITGIVLLVPSISSFLIYKSLRGQQRIKIHICLFISCLLTGIFCLIWDVLIRLDRFYHDQSTSNLYINQSICKTLHMLHRFTRTSSFLWMSCEGFYLHRLLVNAFTPPKHFYGYVIYGWGLPVVLCCLYSALRKFLADDNVCWILPLDTHVRALDWILIYSPTILCISINFVFLINILRLLLTKMAKHPQEPSNFRKAFKATFLLVPLFGIHQFCLIYRPNSKTTPGYDVYEIASAIILNSQGIIISLLLCFFNTEVRGHIRMSLKHLSTRIRESAAGLRLSQSVTSTSRRTSMSSINNAINNQPDFTGHITKRNFNKLKNIFKDGDGIGFKTYKRNSATTPEMSQSTSFTVPYSRKNTSEDLNDLNEFDSESDLTRVSSLASSCYIGDCADEEQLHLPAALSANGHTTLYEVGNDNKGYDEDENEEHMTYL